MMATMIEDAAESRRRRPGVAAVTRVKIMEAAERLFADRGIDGVALREIAAAAGQGNNTAVQYHFGTKEKLVYEIFAHRTDLFEHQRAAMLATAERAGRLADVRVLLQILCLPHLTIADEHGGHPYSAFLAQYLTRSRAAGIPHPYDNQEELMPALRRTRRLLTEACRHVPPVMLQLRVGLCKLMFCNMLMRRDIGFPHADQDVPLPLLVDDTLDQMAAALSAPYAPREQLFDVVR